MREGIALNLSLKNNCSFKVCFRTNKNCILHQVKHLHWENIRNVKKDFFETTKCVLCIIIQRSKVKLTNFREKKNEFNVNGNIDETDIRQLILLNNCCVCGDEVTFPNTVLSKFCCFEFSQGPYCQIYLQHQLVNFQSFQKKQINLI